MPFLGHVSSSSPADVHSSIDHSVFTIPVHCCCLCATAHPDVHPQVKLTANWNTLIAPADKQQQLMITLTPPPPRNRGNMYESL
jgi:hypothetical protein